jgi:hypothetical protein
MADKGKVHSRLILAALLLAAFAFAQPAAGAEKLPGKAPRPEANPQAPRPEVNPKPAPKAADAPGPQGPESHDHGLPIPSPRPHDDEKATAPPLEAKPTPPRPPSPPPEEERSCRDNLRKLGAVFVEHDPLSDPAGCSAPHPITVTKLTRDIAIEPEAVLNCAMAEAASKFVADVVAPAAKSDFGSALKSVYHESAYVCRSRNGTGKLSEHAFANALDIGAFTLADGRRIDVRKSEDDKQADFLSRIRSAACGPFKTVLGPGTNADHEFHFHFDLQPRRNGGTYCR